MHFLYPGRGESDYRTVEPALLRRCNLASIRESRDGSDALSDNYESVGPIMRRYHASPMSIGCGLPSSFGIQTDRLFSQLNESSLRVKIKFSSFQSAIARAMMSPLEREMALVAAKGQPEVPAAALFGNCMRMYCTQSRGIFNGSYSTIDCLASASN